MGGESEAERNWVFYTGEGDKVDLRHPQKKENTLIQELICDNAHFDDGSAFLSVSLSAQYSQRKEIARIFMGK